jgi:hypothetical protein
MHPPQNVMLLYCGRTGLRIIPCLATARFDFPSLVRRRFIATAPQPNALRSETVDLPLGVSGRVKLEYVDSIPENGWYLMK